MELTPQQIQATQGTRLSDKPQWEAYNEEMGDSKLSPELQEQIKHYQERVHERNKGAEEELARQKELSDATAEQYCWVTKEEYEYIEPRVGKIIHSSVFLNKLRTEFGLNCWYAAHPLAQRLKLVVHVAGKEPVSPCWLQEGFQVEYSWMNFDEHNVPLAERRRGWRTVCLQLILKGIISEKQVDEVFGKATGPASERYNSLLYEFRNKKVKIKEE